MLKQVRVMAALLIVYFILCSTVNSFCRDNAHKKNKAAVECRLLEDDFSLELLQEEFESIKKYIIPRSKYTNLWYGIPLKNPLGVVDARGLQLSLSVVGNRMKKCYPTSYLEKLVYIPAILDQIEKRFKTEVGLVRIFKLPSESSLPLHRDGSVFNLHTGKVFRLHIPIITSSDVQFIINDKIFYLQPGKMYFTNVSLPHFVVNNSKIDRIHLIIDVHANNELRKYILNSKQPEYVLHYN